jgi:hypothetical protein
MARMGHSSSAAALRYQHVMAGRDAAIAACGVVVVEHSMSYPNSTDLHHRISTLASTAGWQR